MELIIFLNFSILSLIIGLLLGIYICFYVQQRYIKYFLEVIFDKKDTSNLELKSSINSKEQNIDNTNNIYENLTQDLIDEWQNGI